MIYPFLIFTICRKKQTFNEILSRFLEILLKYLKSFNKLLLIATCTNIKYFSLFVLIYQLPE
jgi:hypothetical protein